MNRPVRIDLTPMASLNVMPGNEASFRKEAYLFKEVVGFLDKHTASPRYCQITLVDGTATSSTIPLPSANMNMILLASLNYFMPDIMYSFAHEYCHHTIDRVADRASSTNLLSCHPLDECVCCVSSLFQLSRLADCCLREGNVQCARILRECRDYILRHRQANTQTQRREGIRRFSRQRIGADGYLYLEGLAALLLPVFERNHSLWGICRHIGSIPPWLSHTEALDYLRRTAGDSYRDSLEEMIALLLP